MAIFSGAASAANFALEKLGLDWVTGFVAPGIEDATLVPMIITFPEYVGNNPIPFTQYLSVSLAVPNHSSQFGEIALNMAQNALVTLELAVALQNIIDPEGGLRIKDQLDPYHYNVIKNSLEENGEPVPELTEPNANILNDIGGAITEFGLLSNLGTVADALRVAGQLEFLKFTPQLSPFPGVVAFNSTSAAPDNVNLPSVWAPPGAGFPDYSYSLAIMNSAVAIQGFVAQYAVSIFRNAIDTDSQALLLKGVLGQFGKQVSDNAITGAGKTPPEWEEPKGQSGLL